MSNDAQAPDANVEPQKSNVPTEPGWYWWQSRHYSSPGIIRVDRVGGVLVSVGRLVSVPVASTDGHGRWSDRIEPPANMTGGAE